MTADWRLMSGSVAGLDHARKGGGCEDSFATCQIGRTVILAVADGGSRLPLSAVGASLAVAVAVSHTRDLLAAAPGDGPPTDAMGWHACLRKVVADIGTTFALAAAEVAGAVPGASPRDLGTTLTLAVACLPWLAVASIGDGFVVTRCGADHLDLLMPPDSGATTDAVVHGEPARTTFLTSPGAAGAMRTLIARIPDLSGIAVSTDGLRELSLVYTAALAQYPHGGFFRPVFARADAGDDETLLLRLLASEQVCALTADDKTLVVAVRR
jgi:protein phosphatase 2C-like protein